MTYCGARTTRGRTCRNQAGSCPNHGTVGSSGSDLQALPAATTTNVQYEQCTGASFGLTDTTGTLVGCLQLPQGEPAPVDHLTATEAKPCTPSTPEPVQPRIYTPHYSTYRVSSQNQPNETRRQALPLPGNRFDLTAVTTRSFP